jgi:hypothetical protein
MCIRCRENVFSETFPSSSLLFLLITNLLPSNGRRSVVCFAPVVKKRMLFQSRSLATAVPLAPQFLPWANMTQYFMSHFVKYYDCECFMWVIVTSLKILMQYKVHKFPLHLLGAIPSCFCRLQFHSSLSSSICIFRIIIGNNALSTVCFFQLYLCLILFFPSRCGDQYNVFVGGLHPLHTSSVFSTFLTEDEWHSIHSFPQYLISYFSFLIFVL